MGKISSKWLPAVLYFVFTCILCQAQAMELAGQSSIQSAEQVEKQIRLYTQRIENDANDTQSMVALGNLYFMLRDFEQAIENYDRALSINDQLDAAYFGRGMARGRAGFIKKGIEDLTYYLHRHPDSSLAYTKRGIRHLWLDEENEAMKDFQKAIALNPDNAEAHDDLGVIYAKRKNYTQAIKHFSRTVRLDPSYQKAHHNLAMAYYLVGQDSFALDSVNHALALNSQDRNSMLLKSVILKALGRNQEAEALRDEADFLPEGNWSESISVD